MTHLETLVEDQQNTIENVAELQRRDMSSLTEHLQSVISTYTQPLVEKVSAMERQVTGLQIENKNLRQKQLQLEQKMGEMEATPAPRQDLTPITGKIVKLESHFIAISKRIDALSNSFDNHLFSRKSREREEVDKEAIEGGTGSSVNIRNESKMIFRSSATELLSRGRWREKVRPKTRSKEFFNNSVPNLLPPFS